MYVSPSIDLEKRLFSWSPDFFQFGKIYTVRGVSHLSFLSSPCFDYLPGRVQKIPPFPPFWWEPPPPPAPPPALGFCSTGPGCGVLRCSPELSRLAEWSRQMGLLQQFILIIILFPVPFHLFHLFQRVLFGLINYRRGGKQSLQQLQVGQVL